MNYIRETGTKFMKKIKEHERSQKLEDDKLIFIKYSDEYKTLTKQYRKKKISGVG